ncbi:MAG TPA: hypothetical protein VKK19_09380 [Candidatus Dormibacteraeota bacterium]|nr:hypothetical protein [Candidatus Dormibacteraeota bacterium]
MRRTRQSLREPLLAVVAQKGYDRVTVQEVMDRPEQGHLPRPLP